jgi:hypothetical protein
MSDASPPAERSRPAWYLLGFAALVVAAAAVYLIAPDLPRRALSSAAPVPPLGDAPGAIGEVGGELADREPRPALPAIGRRTDPGPAAPVVTVTPEPAAPALPPPGDAQAVASLDEAERRYAAMDWDGAARLAGRIGSLPSRPTVAERAAGIARGAVALKRLFAALDHRDELQRNWDTHPSLLSLDDDGRPELLVPLAASEDPPTAVTEDPLGWTEGVRRSGVPGWFLYRTGSSFSKAHIVPKPGRLIRVDQQSLAVRLGQQLDRMVARIDGDADMRDDPNAWYEAGKFAYRNRLDARVTTLLDRAFRLDPELASTIREGNAGALSGAMVGHIRNGNRQQAASYMRIIDERYADTRQGRLARLYYDGRTAELIAAARAPAPAVPVDAPPAAPVAAAAPADLARARQLWADGSKPYYQASGMPATDERNRLYHQASTILRQAKAAYALWCEAHPEDAAAAAEAFEAGRMEVAARKYATL